MIDTDGALGYQPGLKPGMCRGVGGDNLSLNGEYMVLGTSEVLQLKHPQPSFCHSSKPSFLCNFDFQLISPCQLEVLTTVWTVTLLVVQNSIRSTWRWSS